MTAGCPKHKEQFSRDCFDSRCRQNWSPEDAPTHEEQLTLWAAGKSVCPNVRHECCPDFSCCKPEIGWPLEKRAAFIAAGQREREEMMIGALNALITSKKVRFITTDGLRYEIKTPLSGPKLVAIALAGAFTAKAIIYIALRVLG